MHERTRMIFEEHLPNVNGKGDLCQIGFHFVMQQAFTCKPLELCVQVQRHPKALIINDAPVGCYLIREYYQKKNTL